MKLKNICRTAGAGIASIGTGFTYLGIRYAYLAEMVNGNTAFEEMCKGNYRAAIGFVGMNLVALMGLPLIADGLSDIITGHHHHFLFKTEQYLSRSDEEKRKIDDELTKWDEAGNREIRLGDIKACMRHLAESYSGHSEDRSSKIEQLFQNIFNS